MENTFTIKARILRYNVGGMLTLGLWFPNSEFHESTLSLQARTDILFKYDLVPADYQPFETCVVLDLKEKEATDAD